MNAPAKPEAVQKPIQFSVTRIGEDVFRLVVQSDKRIVYTANVERKNIARTLAEELDRLHILPF